MAFTNEELNKLKSITKGTNWKFQISKVPDRWVTLKAILARLEAAESIVVCMEYPEMRATERDFYKAWRKAAGRE